MSPLPRSWIVSTAFLAVACIPEPMPLPTQDEIAALDRSAPPPLYQLLYDAPTLPAEQTTQQRVRMLIWLQQLSLSDTQLELLERLHRATAERRDRILAAEQEAHRRWLEQTTPVYAELEALLLSGATAEDPQITAVAERLAQQQAALTPEAELLRIRVEGIRAILEAEGELLRTLSPAQEMVLVDALFFLRSHLDPVGTPGDFRALIGTTYEPGQYAVLTRGAGEGATDPLNIAGLWSDEVDATSPVFHQARREVLLYLALLEPALGEAITALRQARSAAAPPPPAP